MPESRLPSIERAVFAALPLSFVLLLAMTGHLRPYVSLPGWFPGSFAVFGAIAVVFIVSSFGSFAIAFGKAIDRYRGRT